MDLEPKSIDMKNKDTFWIDQGGTVTDCLEFRDGFVRLTKTLTHQSSLSRSGDIRKGTTAATNAILESKGAPVSTCHQSGLRRSFGSLEISEEIGLFDLYGHRKQRLRAEVHEIDGRISSTEGF